ncbi:uncharacterized protein Dwil_GK26795 [Drosophila willistoni]|uniref:Uncharacterized protein n=1 Tax=Drosophila willistoni TaxID=7260 RepID=A0A0Q9X1V5_DROWI|nr:uncharacterized protein Dwil_GK26795 [Drosophila willistoni]
MSFQCFGGNNYDFRLESFLAIKGEEETLADFQNIKLIGRERALNGSFSVGIDLTDDILCSFEAFRAIAPDVRVNIGLSKQKLILTIGYHL